MTLSAFSDQSSPPTNQDLARALGKTFVLWNELQNRVTATLMEVSFEWGFTSKKTGWGMRVKAKDRIIFYMTPCDGYFLASFALGEKAVNIAHKSQFPARLLRIIDSATKYAEGRGVRLEVRSASDVRSVERLVTIKTST